MSPDPLLVGGVMEQYKITTKDTVWGEIFVSINFGESLTRQRKNFEIFIFVTRSQCLTTEMVTLGVYFNVEMILRRYHAYQSVLVTVDKKLPCQREGSNSEDLFTDAVMTGKLIIGHEKFLQFA